MSYSANDLYNVKDYQVAPDLVLLGKQLPEVPELEWSYVTNEQALRVQLRTVFSFDFDYRRSWVLTTVWFDGAPLMVLQNAGRSCNDYKQRYITNEALFSAMVNYLKTLLADELDVQDEVVDPDKSFPELTSFYGNSLGGEFKKYAY